LRIPSRLGLPSACLAACLAFGAAQAAHSQDAEPPFLVRPAFAADWFEASLEAGGEELEYSPNPTMAVGAKLGYKGVSLSLFAGVSRLEDEEEYGKSTNVNLGLGYPFGLSGRELVASAFFHYHEDLSVPVPGGGRRLIEGMGALDAGVEGVLILNRGFSLSELVDAAERRSGSSSSWLLRSSLGVMYLGFLQGGREGRAFVPPELAAAVGDLADLSLVRDLYLSVSGGWIVDWNIIRPLSLTFLGSMGLTASRIDLSYADGSSGGGWTTGPSVSTLIGLTYAARRFHAGLSAASSLESAQAGEALVAGTRVSTMLFAGMRF